MKLFIFLLCLSKCYCSHIIDFGARPRKFSMELMCKTELAEKQQVVVSPLGIWTLMTTLSMGTVKNSYNQLQRALLLPRKKRILVGGYKVLESIILDAPVSSGVTLKSTNLIFLDEKFRIAPAFGGLVKKHFNTTVFVLDFHDPNATKIANRCIEETASFQNVLKDDDFLKSNMIVLNLVQFKGLWSLPFNASETKEEAFYDETRREIGRVNMMYQKSGFAFMNVPGILSSVIELPYGDGNKYSMLILMPRPYVKVRKVYDMLRAGTIKIVLERLDNTTKEEGLREIDVKIPRFKINSEIEMTGALKELGVTDIFSPTRADFGLITDDKIYVSTIVHKAEIEVTESGTVASAISKALVADRSSAPSFYINRPFMYFITEKTSKTIIFNGVYSKPSLY